MYQNSIEVGIYKNKNWLKKISILFLFRIKSWPATINEPVAFLEGWVLCSKTSLARLYFLWKDWVLWEIKWKNVIAVLEYQKSFFKIFIKGWSDLVSVPVGNCFRRPCHDKMIHCFSHSSLVGIWWLSLNSNSEFWLSWSDEAFVVVHVNEDEELGIYNSWESGSSDQQN